MSQIHTFSQAGCTSDQEVWERSGKRGQRALELAELKMPVVPGFIFDSTTVAGIQTADVKTASRPGLDIIEQGIGRKYGNTENPLLVKVVCSANLVLPLYPTVFNIGLSPQTIPGFAKMIGEENAWFEYCYLLRTAGVKLYDIPEDQFDAIEKKYDRSSAESMKTCADEMKGLVGAANVPDDPLEQLEVIVKAAAKRYYDPDLDVEDNLSIMVQGMVFGNLNDEDMVGMFYSRNIITGENQLEGSYLKKAYTLDKKGEKIHTLDAALLEDLKKIGRALEQKFHELREVKFIVERGKIWLINQTSEDRKSTQAHIRTLLDLMKEGAVQDTWVVEQIPPGQLATLLHPIVDPASVAEIPSVEGGLAGSPGAAVGRVFFSADSLMEAHREALQKGEDTRLILVVHSVEGGYSSHAPVVARSMGKVAIVNDKLNISPGQFELTGDVVREGDYVTMDVPVYKPPTIFLGKAELINPDCQTNGLIDFIEVIKKHISDDFVVRANADLGRDAKTAKMMGAYGIGLCRTEHMFFADDRIHRFREMVLATDTAERVKALADLQPLQRQDFYDLFKTMAPYPVTIRLLDAPLHEFLPRTPDVLNDYLQYLQAKGTSPNQAQIEAKIERLHEFNPMLGHRGCRVAITYPEIYEMQVRAILEAACQLKKEGTEVVPEIMIPLIMNPSELSMIRNGKRIEGKHIKGITNVATEVFQAQGDEVHYRIGTMVELPAAALLSDELARYAEFFSYGTNDLTQTTNGLSRDDSNSFFPAYTEYDLLAANPFQMLGAPVMELIKISAERGRLTRPNIKLGLCGEHGADPVNIEFCRNAGLQYVSCSSYSVPIALLAVAQLNLKAKAAAN